MTDQRFAHLTAQLDYLVQARELANVEHAAEEVCKRTDRVRFRVEMAKEGVRLLRSSFRELAMDVANFLPPPIPQPPPIEQYTHNDIPPEQWHPRVANARGY